MDEELKIKLLMSFFEFKKNNAAAISAATKQLEELRSGQVWTFFAIVLLAFLQLVATWLVVYNKKRDENSNGWDLYFGISWAIIFLFLVLSIVGCCIPNEVFPTPGNLK